MVEQIESKEITSTEPVSDQEKLITQVEENDTERNFKVFREGRKKDRQEREAAEKRASEKEAEAAALKAALESIVNKPNPTNVSHGDFIEDDQEKLIERKVQDALAKQEREMENARIKREQNELPQRLASIHTDFDQVCSEENLEYLEFHYPEVANAYKKLPNTFEKWSDLYKVVKRFLPNTNSKKEQGRAEKNFNKPQSMAVGGTTQTGDSAPIQIDEKRRADNWARMQAVMRGKK